jgi:hypothetical protein
MDKEPEAGETFELAAWTATHAELRDAITCAAQIGRVTLLTSNGHVVAAIVPPDHH